MIATEAQREAIDSLLTFIEEATSLRQTAARHLSRCGRLLRLPELEAAVPGLVAGDPTGSDADLVCRIEKLEMPPCPPIPESLAPYATGDWRAPEWTPDWKALPDPAEHPESAELYETLADWLRIRGSWLEARGEILPNHALFERLQDLRDHLSESNLRDECVIGTAVFTSNPDVTRAKNPVRWPLLVQPLVIELGSSRRNLPVIEVRRNGDEDPRLLAEILAPFAEDGVDLKAASRFEEWLEDAGADANLAGDESLSEALEKFAASLHPDCRFVPAEEALPEDAGEKPAFTLEASPVILIQPRPSGVRSAIRSIRKDIAEHRDVPAHLMEIVCPDVFPTLASGLTPTLSLEAKLAATAGEDPDVLLAKPANPEQLAIAHEVEHNNVVLVQGPPGTGKTHTIANLLGHFLSQGKRVLVTSHTTKALSVVKDLLPKEIQPLCVTMLGDRKDLEQTSSELITRLTRLNVEDLEARIRALGLERHRLGTALADRRRRIFEQRRIEHKAVEFNGRRYTLTEIAKFLREAADALSGVEVDGSRPASKEAFEAVALHARLKAAVKTVARTWDSLAERADAPAFATYGDNAVRTLFTRYGTSLSDTCIWWRRVFVPYIEGLLSAGIEAEGMKELLESADPLEAARRFATDVLAPVHTARHREAELHALREWQATESQKLYAAAPACATARRLAAATLVDPDAWELEAERLRKLLEDQPLFARRTELLERLRAAAPEWANALEAGEPGFTTSNPSPEITNAWLYRQLERIYTRATAADLDALQSDAERLCADLREATAQLAVAKAWLAVKSRLSNGPALSNLFSLAAYMKRAVGRGRKSAAWRREVNRLLPACQQAVPVWIMMIQDALLNFSTASKFDVIVVDEASQADMTALPLLYMGKKVIVVGDDRQVTPLSVGTSEAAVDALCARHLEGRVKEPKLYDSRLSLYGLVQSMAFPAHMLVEHFRSVPEIIGWCSRLSYNGTIRPLRDASSSSLKPAVVPWRTRGTAGDNGVNEEEAQAVIRLLRAMIHDPAYDGKTFGIIPMRSVHGAQVNRIRRLLVENFDPREIERRRIHCGIPAEFQGDERDVVILSLVDSAAPGLPLRKETDGADGMMKKRWNVAVSRARDQLWLVHSFDPAAQLKPDDLRRSLFDWADGVMSGTIGAAEPFDLPDPEFTGQVLRALRKRGYRVEAGHDAGAWRLDMVVRARGRAAAIECDGSGREDEDAIRRDMERQTVLERAGWKFVRVRSADWFRRPEKTLERVCEALAALGIAPEPEDCAPQTDLLLAHVRANVERLEAGLDMIVFDKEDEDPVPPVAPVTPADLAPDDADPVITAPVQFEAPLMPVEVEKADIMLIPEMEMRDAVRISLPTLSDVFDDEPAAEADAETEDEAQNEPAAESCGDPHHTPVTFMEVIRDGLMDRGINPVLQTTPNDATMTIGGRTLLRATFWSGRADVLVPAFDDVKPRTCAGCRLVHNGAWRMWSLAEADLTQRFVQDFVVFIARTAEALR